MPPSSAPCCCSIRAIGTYQEWRAETRAQALKALIAADVSVWRDGRLRRPAVRASGARRCRAGRERRAGRRRSAPDRSAKSRRRREPADRRIVAGAQIGRGFGSGGCSARRARDGAARRHDSAHRSRRRGRCRDGARHGGRHPRRDLGAAGTAAAAGAPHGAVHASARGGDDRRNRRFRRPRSIPRHRAGRDFPARDRTSRRRDPGKLAGRDDRRAVGRDAPHGAAQRRRAPAAGGRGARRLYADRHRQDRDPDGQPADRRTRLAAGGRRGRRRRSARRIAAGRRVACQRTAGRAPGTGSAATRSISRFMPPPHGIVRPTQAASLAARIPYEPEKRFGAAFHRAGDGLAAYVKGSPGDDFRVLRRSARARPRKRPSGSPRPGIA